MKNMTLTGIMIGTITAALVYFVMLLGVDNIAQTWLWRVPFLLSVVIIIDLSPDGRSTSQFVSVISFWLKGHVPVFVEIRCPDKLSWSLSFNSFPAWFYLGKGIKQSVNHILGCNINQRGRS